MISEAELKKVAKLARLELSAAEMAIYPKQFAAILEYFEQIAKIDTANVEPLLTPTDMDQHLRPDQASQWKGAAEAAMANAPERSGNLFKVPPVV
ncbi:MAG: Asp-tRNA(Asn)/Glu-tRNA(Gln) amidotransferase subunit GatC [Bdellovibrionales bacterium]